MSRYSVFYRKLLQSPSREVQFLAKLVSTDPRSNTCSNLRYLVRMTSLDQPQYFTSARMRAALPVQTVPQSEEWRLGLIRSLISLRGEKWLKLEETKNIQSMLDSLCST